MTIVVPATYDGWLWKVGRVIIPAWSSQFVGEKRYNIAFISAYTWKRNCSGNLKELTSEITFEFDMNIDMWEMISLYMYMYRNIYNMINSFMSL